MSRRRVIVALVGGLISLALLVLLVRELQLDEIAAAMSKVSLPILLCSIVALGIGFIFMALRTRALLGTGTSLVILTKSHLAGFAGNNLLPFRLGELVRIDWQSRATGLSRSHLLATAGIERLLDLFVLFILFLGVAPLAVGDIPEPGGVALLGSFLTLSVFGLAIVLKNSESLLRLVEQLLRPFGAKASSFVLEHASGFFDGLADLSSPRTVVASVLLSLGYWSMTLVSVQIWIVAFGLDLPWYAPLYITGFLAFGTAIPSAPGFIGTWHFLCRTALISLGVAKVTAVAFAFVGHFMAIVPFTLFSILWLGLGNLTTGWGTLQNNTDDRARI